MSLPNPNISDVQARIARVSGLYARAQGEIEGLVSRVTDELTGKQRTALTKHMKVILQELGEQRDPQVHGLLRLAYARGIHLVDTKAKFTEEDEEKLVVLQKSLSERLYQAETTAAKTFSDAIRRTRLRTSAIALQESHGTGDALATMLRPTGLLDRRGSRWALAQYAGVAICTVTHETLSEATVSEMFRQEKSVVIVSHNGGSVTEACEPYDSRTFSLWGDNKSYPTIDKLPPFHPGCEHFIYPR